MSDNVADLTIHVLREIRDEARKTNARLDQTNARLDQTNARLDGLQSEMHEGFTSLRTEMHEGFTSLRTEMHEGFTSLRTEMRDGVASLQGGVERLGRRIDNVLLGEHRRSHQTLEERVARIEAHLKLDPS